MPKIRIRPGLPCKGISLPSVFVEHEWVSVDEATAAHAAKVRLHATGENSPFLLEVEDAEPSAAPAPTEDEGRHRGRKGDRSAKPGDEGTKPEGT